MMWAMSRAGEVLYIEQLVAPKCITAASITWKSGRFSNISATTSARRTPQACKAAETSATAERYRA